MPARKRAPSRARIERTAREAFGFDELRPGQLDGIRSALKGRDTLVVMSTGSGKSAIYQVAGMLLDGATVVVSPLISLQRDQIEAIDDELPGEAAALDGSVGEKERRRRLRDLAGEEIEFLFLAPEQLAREETVRRLAAAGVSLLVIDEAHCISEWGHDFRPDYLRLGAFVEELGRPVVLALTATASPPVREEIVERLRMEDPEVIVRGFDRPNIVLSVKRFHDERAKQEALLERVRERTGSGIVYVATRKLAEELAERLEGAGVRARAYHGGMSSSRRDESQQDFMADRVEVMVATTAFGMGVDKPDVRFVFHHDPSDSVDSYYQEIGRAGRDGEPAEATLFYRSEDLGLRRFFAGGGLDGETIQRVAETVAETDEPVHPADLREELDLSESRTMSALSRLEDSGALELRPDGKVDPTRLEPDEVEDAVEQAAEAEQQRRLFDRSRLEMMRSYAEHDRCRRAFVLSYFGEPHQGECGNCDNCLAGHGRAEASDEPFPAGERVSHSEWGQGVVQRYDGDQMTVLFDAVGYKTLSVEIVAGRGLLSPA
ncbi:MAG TPA: ATP-dependent DNA helicase RecQ [Thermoleophilaceae bacterium]|nr:ATP-dependent DNA helicase RecQ [Thermoleophilaceae bacterium]